MFKILKTIFLILVGQFISELPFIVKHEIFDSLKQLKIVDNINQTIWFFC